MDRWSAVADGLVERLAASVKDVATRQGKRSGGLFGALRGLLRGADQDTSSVAVDRWQADQGDGTLVLVTEQDIAVTYRAAIVGSHDGQTFKWSWHNPSISDAMQPDRGAVEPALAAIGDELTEDNLSISGRDAWALAGAAGEATGAIGVYIGRAQGETLVFFLVYEALDRVPAASVADHAAYGSPFQLLRDLVEAQVSDFPELLHQQAQQLANAGHAALDGGRSGDALGCFEDAWRVVEQHQWPWDTPISGYIRHGMAEACYADGQFGRAAELLSEAVRHRLRSGPFARTLVRLGQARRRAGDPGGASDAFLRAHVVGGVSLDGEDPDDLALLEARLNRLRAERAGLPPTAGPPIAGVPSDAQAVVGAFGRGLDSLNRFAMQGAAEAEKHREEAHILSDADEQHEEAVTRRWCELVATWCTPGKRGHLSAYGSESPHHPDRESVVRGSRNPDGRLEVWTRSVAAADWADDDTYVYVLEELPHGWFVHDAMMVFDPGEPSEERYSIFD